MASTGVARISLAPAPPPATRTDHFIHIRARTTSGSGAIAAALYEGDFDRSGTLQATISTAFSSYFLGLSNAAAESITSYDNLELRLSGSSTSAGIVFEISDAVLSTPEPAASTTRYGAAVLPLVGGVWTNGVVEGEEFYTGVARLSLAAGDDPGVDVDHAIVLRARVTAGSGNLLAALYEGSTNRSGDLMSGTVSSSFMETALALSTTSAAAITSYSDLELRVWGKSTVPTTFEIAKAQLSLPVGTNSHTVLVGVASETGSAHPVSAGQGLPPLYPGLAVYPSETYYDEGGTLIVGIAVDTNTVLPVTASGSALVTSVGIASDYSYALAREAPITVPVGLATETSVAIEVGSEGGAEVVKVGIPVEWNQVGEVGGSGALITRSIIKAGTEDLVIGAQCLSYAPSPYTYGSYFQGVVDELALLGGAISDQEVKDLYGHMRHVGTDSGSYNASTGIWAGTTNLLPNGGFESGVSGWSAINGATLSHETTTFHLGGGALKIVTDAASEGATTASLATTVSETYVGSVWLSGSGVVRLELEERTSGDTVVATTVGSDISLTSSWRRVGVTRVFGATGAKARLRVIGQSSAATIYADGAQLEKQAIATPYVETNGLSATRGGARLQVPGGYLDETQGWVAARIRVGWGNDAEPGEAKVFDWRDSSSAYLSLYYDTTSNSFVMKRTDGASPATSTVAHALAANDRVTLIAAWTSSGAKLSVNGSAFTAASGTGIPGLSATHFDLGSQGGTQSFLNGDFLWFACGQGTLTDTNASLLHDWNDEPPRLHTYPAAALVKFAWDGVDEWGVEAGYTHPLTAGRIRRIFHQPGIKRGATQIEVIDLMERLSTEMGTLSAVSTEYMGEAIGRILDRVGLTDPSTRDLDNGEGGLTRVQSDGTRTWLDILTDIIMSDYGIFWINGRGHAVFRERRSRPLAPYKGRLSRELRALQPGIDLDRVVNTWTVEAADQAEEVDPIPATAGYSRSQRRYGTRLSTVTAHHLSTYEQAYSLSEYLVRRTSDPDAPVYALTVSNRSDRQLAMALGLEVGDMIGVLAEKTIGYYIVEQVATSADVSEGLHEVSLVLTAL